LCDPIVTHGLYLSTLETGRNEALYKLTFVTFLLFTFVRRITFCHLPFQAKWMYIGTDHGNVHVMNIESFLLSGYAIMWNKAIEL